MGVALVTKCVISSLVPSLLFKPGARLVSFVWEVSVCVCPPPRL